jgi:hypothetical protein
MRSSHGLGENLTMVATDALIPCSMNLYVLVCYLEEAVVVQDLSLVNYDAVFYDWS